MDSISLNADARTCVPSCTYSWVHLFIERTGLEVQLGTHVSREDWSARTAGYKCF